MRDYLVLAIVLGGAPIAVFSPWIGILLWYWIGFMNPHQLAWGLARQFHIAEIIAIATLIGLILSKERKRFTPDALTFLFLVMWLYFTITTFTSIVPNQSWPQWEKVSKIFLMSFVTIILFHQPARFRLLVLVVTLSLAFYGVKGGVWTLLTGGSGMVLGPPHSFFGGNTGISVVLNMILPFLFFYGVYEPKKFRRFVSFACFFLTMIAVIGTRSRGGLVGLVGVLLAILLVTTLSGARKNVVVLFFVAASMLIAVHLAPQKWYEKMETIGTYKEDRSALGRINAWHFAYNLAMERPLVGGGFEAFDPDLFLRYAPEPKNFHDAHSIYFEVLGEHGFVGLLLFLSILFMCFRTLGRLRKISQSLTGLGWMTKYIYMALCSIVGYMANGLTIGLAYFDFYWLLVVLTICLNLMACDYVKMLHLAYSNRPESVLAVSRFQFS